MAFLKKYNKSESYSYNKVIQVDNAMYSVGKIGNSNSDGLILKTGTFGNIIWEKRFGCDDAMEFHDVLACQNGDIIVISTDVEKAHVLRINTSGDIVWSKVFSFSAVIHRRNLLRYEEAGVENFVIEASYSYNSGSIGIHFLKIDGEGSVIIEKFYKTTTGDTLFMSNIATDGTYIFSRIENTVIVLDKNFEIYKKFVLSIDSGGYFETWGIIVDGNNLVLYGTNQNFSSVIQIAYYLENYPVIKGFKFNIYFSDGRFAARDNFAYVSTLDDLSQIYYIYKLDFLNFEITWRKYFESVITDSQKIHLFHIAENTANFILSEKIVGNLNLDFESCKTVMATPGDFEIITGFFDTPAYIETLQLIFSVDSLTITTTNIVSHAEEICVFPGPTKVDIGDNSMLQSPNFYLQAAGSTGGDSTAGIHLRWMLKGGLSEHLPKANYATPGINFNKANDFVKIYRAPYYASKVTLDLTVIPGIIDDEKYFWVYAVGRRVFHVNFLNTQYYDEIRSAADPAQSAEYFLSTYMDYQGIIEIENKNDLSFAITPYFHAVIPDNIAIKLEILSVEKNAITAPKNASLRKTYGYSSLHGKKILSENIRSIRMQNESLYLNKVEFEFYSDFIDGINNGDGWTVLGEHALTLDNQQAYERLEPEEGLVDGSWLRYNDDAYVNVDNYKNRWDGQDISQEERIKDCVQKYISLSDVNSNPLALETFSYPPVEGQEPGEENTFELSNLHLLNIAALDYHIARMLGLGILDTAEEVTLDKYVYVAEYLTFGDLKDGLGAREVRHLYCTLPTSLNDFRLPVPVDLNKPVPGIYQNNMVESTDSITDTDGYSYDGTARFISLFHLDLPEEKANMPFFYKNDEFISSGSTIPVYAGIEYKKSEDTNWRKPELSFNSRYNNIDLTANDDFEKKETISIMIPEPGYALYVHREKQSGWHDYSSYGINWFSRASASQVSHSIQTLLKPANTLLPPTNVNAVFIQKENPLFLTSATEQGMLNTFEEEQDKTLIRLTFEYDFAQEQKNYHKAINYQIIQGFSMLDDDNELFAEDIEIFFRNNPPQNISGKVISVTNEPTNPLIALIETGPYELVSTGQQNLDKPNEWLVPSIPSGMESNYEGGIVVIDGQEFMISSVGSSGGYPTFKVLKRTGQGMITDLNEPLPDQLISPVEGGMFVIVENMQSEVSWNTYSSNPHSFKVAINQTQVYQEDYTNNNMDNVDETHIQKFRGIFEDAIITKIYEDTEVYSEGSPDPVIIQEHLGLYMLVFPSFSLNQHSQFSSTGNSVEFFNGTVRIHTISNPNGQRKIFKVVKTKNIGITDAPLTLYITDLTFPSEENGLTDYDGKIVPDGQDTLTQKVNYYPGYKTYLYKDNDHGLTESAILPLVGDQIRYSVFSLRSHDTGYNYRSKLSVPAIMFARSVAEPKVPEQPIGPLFATRPDFFGKASYTFTTKFEETPYSIQFGRASDIQILNTLFDSSNNYLDSGYSTVDYISQIIFKDGLDEYYTSRWQDFFKFGIGGRTLFGEFPVGSGIILPLPDNQALIASINAFIDRHNEEYSENIDPITTISSLNQLIIPPGVGYGTLIVEDFLRDITFNCFVPLTEIPIIYSYINGSDYTPIPKKQVVRDKNGNLLSPSDNSFDMAPMMKVIETSPQVITQFTDFGLDGASRAKFFYAAKEISLQMQSSLYSPVLGPVNLVNTSAATPPAIVKITSVLEDNLLGIRPGVSFTINSYPDVQDIRKINLYRTSNGADSLTVRSMELVKVIDLEDEAMLEQSVWQLTDNFDDLSFVPYGDPLYYRITVSRKIRYNDAAGNLIIDYAPSEMSKLIMTNVANNHLPESPKLEYTSEPFDGVSLNDVILRWDSTVYNGKYHIYKLNGQGNWSKLQTLISNDVILEFPIGDLDMITTDNEFVKHHFKVLAENFSGMLSTKEWILTIYITEEGIGAMIIQDTFIVSPDV